jgi:hypothetical protein
VQSKAQYSIAGIDGQYHVDILPDTLLNAPYNGTEIYFADINGDAINDVKFTSSVSVSPGGQVLGVSLTALNNSTKFDLNYIDSTYNNFSDFWITTKILKKYSFLDTISEANFNSTSFGELGFTYYSGGVDASNSDWVGAIDKFIGIMYADSNSVSFGWLNINVPNAYSCEIKAYSLNLFETKIKNLSTENTIHIYPLPANDVVYLQSSQLPFNKKDIPFILDMNGKQISIPIQQINSNTYKLDASTLTAGMYFLVLQTEKGVVRKKLVIEL